MGSRGTSACTLGHQDLFFTQRTLSRILRENNEEPFFLPNGRSAYFAEDVLRPIGFERVDIMDVSAYEGANVIHDLNLPVPPNMHESYDLILDGGTLEHVFNFPAALENVMRMAKVGGDILLISPANNYCGHGFYQVSPELYFRMFVPENGFSLLRIYMASGGLYYHIADPIDVHGRVELLASEPALLMVHARKVAHVPAKVRTPQQSDYVALWQERLAEKEAKKQDGRFKAFVRERIRPESVIAASKALNSLRLMLQFRRWRKRSRLSNRKFYVPVRQWNLTTRQAFESNQ